MSEVRKGDRYVWREVIIEVIRVDLFRKWADIRCNTGGGATWTKRQNLPFPREFKKVTEPCSTTSIQCKNTVCWLIKAADKRMYSCGVHLHKVCRQMKETGVKYMTLEGEGDDD